MLAMTQMTGQEQGLYMQCVCVKEEGRMLTGNVKAFIQILHFYHHFRFFQICLNKLITVYLCHVLNITYKLNYFQTLSLIQSTLSFRSHLFLIFVIHLSQSNHQG